MEDKIPNLVNSSYSGFINESGIKIELCIYRLEHEAKWALEVVNADGASFVWDDQFASDDDAYTAFKDTVSEEGMEVFLDKGNIIQFPSKS